MTAYCTLNRNIWKIFRPICLIETYMLRCQCLPAKVKPVRSLKTRTFSRNFFTYFLFRHIFFVYHNVKGLISILFVIENPLEKFGITSSLCPICLIETYMLSCVGLNFTLHSMLNRNILKYHKPVCLIEPIRLIESSEYSQFT